ncbi:hypothetical protein MMC09_000480 [Bachmanniomyces sp. S44760]|nr:hypothetical protein [Bachmanniomyces sp. S44760]
MSDTDKHRFVGQRGSKHFQEQTLPYKQTTKRPRIYPTAHQSREPRKFRKGPWIIGGVAVYSFTLYGFFLYNSLSHVIKDPPNLDVPRDVADRYDRTAKGFDSEVNLSEKLMGLGWLRQSLTGRAIGNVLEASVGTGRNIQYFNLKKVKSLTVVDQSSEMLNIAKEKFHGIPNFFAAALLHSNYCLRYTPEL